MKSEHDAHLELATRTTWDAQVRRALAPKARQPVPRAVWADHQLVISRRLWRLAAALGVVGILCLAVSIFVLTHC